MSTSAGKDLASGPAPDDQRQAEYDWRAIEESPEFRELVARKRRFIFPAGIFSLGYFLVYLMLAAYATDFMASRVGGVSVAWLLAVSAVLVTWAVTWLYLRKSDREWDPLEARAAELASAKLGAGSRFVRPADEEAPLR